MEGRKVDRQGKSHQQGEHSHQLSTLNNQNKDACLVTMQDLGPDPFPVKIGENLNFCLLLKTETEGEISVAYCAEWLVLQRDLPSAPVLGARCPSVPTHLLLGSYKPLRWAKFGLSVPFFFNT